MLQVHMLSRASYYQKHDLYRKNSMTGCFRPVMIWPFKQGWLGGLSLLPALQRSIQREDGLPVFRV